MQFYYSFFVVKMEGAKNADQLSDRDGRKLEFGMITFILRL